MTQQSILQFVVNWEVFTINWLQWGNPHLPTKLLILVDQSQKSTTCLIPGSIRPSTSYCIHIWSAILPQYTRQTDREMVGGNVQWL